jgi:hypothetical protein
MLNRNDLHDYQKDIAIPFMKNNPNSGLFLGMGVGKTIICLTALVELLEEKKLNGRVLIIAPKRVAESTWPDEIGKWSHLRKLTYEVIAGDKVTRYVKLHSKALIHIVAYDNIQWLFSTIKGRWPYRTIILDESSFIKSYKAKRFATLRTVVDFNNRELVDRVHVMSASPAVENYEHFWPQIYMLDNGKSLGRYITHFRQIYMESKPWQFGWKIKSQAHAKRLLNKISQCCLVMKSEDYIDIKKPVLRDIYFNLSKQQWKVYWDFWREHVYKTETSVDIIAETAVSLQNKLRQLASGNIYETIKLDDGEDVKTTVIPHPVHNEKVAFVKELIETLDGSPIILAYHWKTSLADLKKEFPKAVAFNDKELDVRETVHRWNQGKIPILLVHPQSASHGLNLQDGGHTIIFYDLPWSWERYDQTIGRVARQGQKEPVNVFHLIGRDTIDQDIRDALRLKTDGNTYMMNKIKEYHDLYT